MSMNKSTMQGHISVRNLTVIYEGKKSLLAVKDLSFDVSAGEFACILGPSGCGKSTTLNVIAGFIKPLGGEILIDGKKITSPGRDRGVVFQNFELFPWKTVFQNIEFGLRMNGIRKEQRRKKVKEYTQLIGLKGFEEKFPFELSAGMAQRVALARVLINDPTVILLDEPFGSIDSQTRISMEELLLRIWQQQHKTVIFVTHDIDEAIFLSDRIIVMTALPGTKKEEVQVPFDRPRNYNITATSEFGDLKLKLRSLIKQEISKGSIY